MMREMSLVKGWCPDMFAPMQAADGWLVRFRPDLGRFSSEALLQIADIAEAYGNGIIELTNRGNLQLRGFVFNQIPEVARKAIAYGLIAADPVEEKRRGLLVSPLAGLDPACDRSTLECAAALRSSLVQEVAFKDLPDKFSFAVDGGGYFPSGSLSADIMLRAENGRWHVACGQARSEETSLEAVIMMAAKVIHAFLENADALRPSTHVQMGQVYLQKAGAQSRACSSGGGIPSVVGLLAGNASGLGVPLGRMDASVLRVDAQIARSSGDGIVRTTPWRSLVVSGAVSTVQGFVTEATDARLRVQACVGKTGCARGAAKVGADALYLALDVPTGRTLHVSGCSKGCAHPSPADMTLVARDGVYDAARNATASDAIRWRGLNIQQVSALLRTEFKETDA